MLLLQWPPTCTHQATHAQETCKQHRQHFQLSNASEIKNWSGKLILLAFMLGTGRLAGAGDNHSGMALGHHLSILYLLRCCRGAHFCFLQNLQRKRHLCFLRISLDNFCTDARRICWCHNSKQQQTKNGTTKLHGKTMDSSAGASQLECNLVCWHCKGHSLLSCPVCTRAHALAPKSKRSETPNLVAGHQHYP